MRKNYLISTTRQWNPGDEFILLGVLNIIKNTIGDSFNPIIFNRNPDIRGGTRWNNPTKNTAFTYAWDSKQFKGKGRLQDLFRIGQYDNSFKNDMNLESIDLAIFAGSPEWYGNRLIPMYNYIEKAKIPSLFMGLGAGDAIDFSKAAPVVNKVLSSAKLITTRDKATEDLLSKYNAKYVPCPALFSAPYERVVNSVKKIALIYATDHTLKGNNVSKDVHKYLLELYPEVIKHFDVGIVCHYIDEIDQARSEFPGVEIYYSYDAKDYATIYNSFDLIIGGRVHGIGMGASLGIPGIMIMHDLRSETTSGFLAEQINVGTDPKEVIDLITNISNNIEERSVKLIAHKSNVMEEYKMKIKESIGDLGGGIR